MVSQIELIVIGVLAWTALLEILYAVWINRSRRKYQNTIRNERIRQHFASARRTLMELAISGEIDVDSITFKSFYSLQTFIMRRPDQYREISQLLLELVATDNSEEDSDRVKRLTKESELWSDKTKDLAHFTAAGLDLIVAEYSWLYRLLSRIEERHGILTRTVKSIESVRVFWNLLRQREEQAHPGLLDLRSIGQDLTRLAST